MPQGLSSYSVIVLYPTYYYFISVASLIGVRELDGYPEDYPAELKRACKSLRHYSWKYAYALDKFGHYLYKDLGVDDNRVTIDW